ncbi:manganese-dependent ADP-ribose/CDP-alcohol diphosphatase-like isoform X1 [Asterias rubens]|uniref:manganese-dependent ADP-ribose/CDP-alcohol diphosphatase-like isoform X1 n=2 Tax=Asterias rubens TaxID=7604 RepID=UPI001455180B|nr:manganese-dependent ADP-ribose/CDP-alcohol diphosphatase-like isoform X1 [Asterias rubens]
MQVSRMEAKEQTCLFSFGLIADIQYADVDNRPNFRQNCVRYYRNSLELLKEAVRHWSGDSCASKPSFVMQLGDIIDGINKRGGKKQSFQALNVVINEFDKAGCDTHHILGNHEFYNFTRAEIASSRLLSGINFETTEVDTTCSCISELIPATAEVPPAAYYHFSPCPGFRCVVLDTYDVSTLGHDKSCSIHQDSMNLLRSVNKNECLNSPDGLQGIDRRFVEYNGGMGESQLRWLEGVLQKASNDQEKVIIFGHAPFHPTIEVDCCLWNYKDVLQLLHSFSCVVAVFSGHVHFFSHIVDEKGIHVVTMPGIIEIAPGSNGFGTVEVYQDKLVLHGNGEVRSCVMSFS